MTWITPYKPCFRGCHILIRMKKLDDGSFQAFEENGERHDCPNSEYNISKRQTQEIKEREAEMEKERQLKLEQVVQQQREERTAMPITNGNSTTTTTSLQINLSTVARIELIAENSPDYLQERYNAFVGKIRSYRAKILGSTYQLGYADIKPLYTVAIFYEIPKDAVHEIFKEMVSTA